jgi:hypothetical protein
MEWILMDTQQTKLTEVSMLMAVAVLYVGQTKPGRVRNRLGMLVNSILPIYRKSEEGLSYQDREAVAEKVKNFGIVTGWLDRDIKPATVISFCLDMLEKSEFQWPDKTWDALNDLLEYYERNGKAKAPNFWAGALASERFKGAVEAL